MINMVLVALLVFGGVVLSKLWRIARANDARRGLEREQAQQARIHQLEFELGFREDAPPVVGFDRIELVDVPGVVIDYDPRLRSTPAGQAALDGMIADARRANGRVETAVARQPITPREDLNEWIEADIARRRTERESGSV